MTFFVYLDILNIFFCISFSLNMNENKEMFIISHVWIRFI